MRKPVLCDDVLGSVCAGHAAFERELLTYFLETTESDAVFLQEAVQGRSTERVGALAHLIQGRSKTIGAIMLADAAEQLETAVPLEAWDTVREAHLRFEHELAALRREIQRRVP